MADLGGALFTGENLEDLVSRYSLSMWKSKYIPELISLKYRQHESPLEKKIVQECRGIILRNCNWDIVARPFDKFFNYGDPNASPLDWDSSRIFHKEDGTLCFLYYYGHSSPKHPYERENWFVGTPGCGDASGKVRKGAIHSSCSEEDTTFAELFWQVFDQYQYELPNQKEYTYMFELTTPLNQLIVVQKSYRLLLLGARENKSGQEYFPDEAIDKFHLNFNCVEEFRVDGAQRDSLMKASSAMDMNRVLSELFGDFSPMEREGFIIADKNFNRVKVKNPAHVAIQHIGDGHVNPKNLLSVIQSAEQGEFLVYFPQYRADLDSIKQKYDELVHLLTADYNRIIDFPQKQFKIQAYGSSNPDCMFALRHQSSSSVRDYLSSLPINDVLKLLHISTTKTKSKKKKKKTKKKTN